MIDDPACLNRLSERIQIAKIAGDEFNRELFQVIEPARAPSEAANFFAAFEQHSNEMRPNEPGSACDKSFHDLEGVSGTQETTNCSTSFLCLKTSGCDVGPTFAECRNKPKLLDNFIERNSFGHYSFGHYAEQFDYFLLIGHRLDATDSPNIEQGQQRTSNQVDPNSVRSSKCYLFCWRP